MLIYKNGQVKTKVKTINDDIKQNSRIFASSEAKNKTALMKFFLSRNIHSLCNAANKNERYVPITGYRRKLHKDK